jgi:epsilon-lactone hydrolase
MNVRAARRAAVTLALLTFSIPASAQETLRPLSVPARELPIPNTVSPELQKVLARPVPGKAPIPTTADDWKKLQREYDAAGAARAK